MSPLPCTNVCVGLIMVVRILLVAELYHLVLCRQFSGYAPTGWCHTCVWQTCQHVVHASRVGAFCQCVIDALAGGFHLCFVACVEQKHTPKKI